MLPSQAWKPTTVRRLNAGAGRRPPDRPHGVAVALVLAALRAYKILISPLFTGCCRFYPSCADYTREAVMLHGAAYGMWLGGWRLARCHPFGGHGVDPVPQRSTSSRTSAVPATHSCAGTWTHAQRGLRS